MFDPPLSEDRYTQVKWSQQQGLDQMWDSNRSPAIKRKIDLLLDDPTQFLGANIRRITLYSCNPHLGTL